MRFALPLLAVALVMPGRAHGEAKPLLEQPEAKHVAWTLALVGGGAFPLGGYSDAREVGLAARTSLAWRSRSGLGVALSAGYAPIPAADAEDGLRRDHQLGHASLAPRFTLGRGTLRLFVGGGGGVVYERTKVDQASSSDTEAAAVAEAGLELHFGETGGITVGGTYMRGLGSEKPQLAAAQAGFILGF